MHEIIIVDEAVNLPDKFWETVPACSLKYQGKVFGLDVYVDEKLPSGTAIISAPDRKA